MIKVGSQSAQKRWGDITVYAILSILAFLFLFPFFWMVLTSLKTLPQANAIPPVWIPQPVQWKNYVAAFTQYLPFGQLLLNTLYVAILVIIGTVISSSMVAYGFAAIEFPGRNILFVILLSTMMIPFMVRLIPLFIIFRNLGWINTLLPLWVPAFFGTPFYIFLMRQFFKTIPVELADAARIDGCTEFGIWWRIMLPLSLPALGVVTLLSFQTVWNQFIEPLVFINDPNKYTVLLGVWFIISEAHERPWHHLMAASTIMVLPMVIVFLLSQRTIVEGITVTGLKG